MENKIVTPLFGHGKCKFNCLRAFYIYILILADHSVPWIIFLLTFVIFSITLFFSVYAIIFWVFIGAFLFLLFILVAQGLPINLLSLLKLSLFNQSVLDVYFFHNINFHNIYPRTIC